MKLKRLISAIVAGLLAGLNVLSHEDAEAAGVKLGGKQ